MEHVGQLRAERGEIREPVAAAVAERDPLRGEERDRRIRGQHVLAGRVGHRRRRRAVGRLVRIAASMPLPSAFSTAFCASCRLALGAPSARAAVVVRHANADAEGPGL
ncbi:MAG: hypothetical protein HS111_28770 [Kofleriaceae bacterium]|nr:hypothetical protein [Kofleriaceae bacterium]